MSRSADLLNRPPKRRDTSHDVPSIDMSDEWKGEHYISISNGKGRRDPHSGRGRLDEEY